MYYNQYYTIISVKYIHSNICFPLNCIISRKNETSEIQPNNTEAGKYKETSLLSTKRGYDKITIMQETKRKREVTGQQHHILKLFKSEEINCKHKRSVTANKSCLNNMCLQWLNSLVEMRV